MQQICLNDFFENNRPHMKDLSLIVYAVCNAVYKNKRNVCLDMERICYDKNKGKVYLVPSKSKTTHKDVLAFVERLCGECCYAGREVYEYVVMLKDIIISGNIDDAIVVTGVYIKNKKENNIYPFLFVAGITVCEVIVLLLGGFSFC